MMEGLRSRSLSAPLAASLASDLFWFAVEPSEREPRAKLYVVQPTRPGGRKRDFLRRDSLRLYANSLPRTPIARDLARVPFGKAFFMNKV